MLHIHYHNLCILEAQVLAILKYPVGNGVVIQSPHLYSAINSYSIMDLAITVYFEDLTLDIQLALLHPSSTTGYLV